MSKIRDKIVTEGRASIDKSIKEGTYMNWLKENYGVMNLDDIMLDKEFLKDMILEIEKTRERNIVYNEDYKKEWLERWRVKNERKLVLRKVFGKEKEGI